MLSFKKALRLLPLYVWLVLCCSLFVILIFIFYAKACDIVAGVRSASSLKNLCIRAFFSVFPVILIFVTLSLGFYKVRHPAGGFLAILVYALLCAFTWLVLYPAFIDLKSTYNHPALKKEVHPLSSGYFRESGENVLYFPSELKDSGTVVLIKPFATEENSMLMASAERNYLFAESEPFQDIIVKKSTSLFPMWIIEGFTLINSFAEKAREKGFLNFLGRVSWALCLCAMYAFTFCTSWRLLSVLYLLIMDAGVLAFNILYHSVYFESFREAGAKIVSHFSFLSHFDDPLLFAVNIILIIVALLVGLGASAVSKKRGFV